MNFLIGGISGSIATLAYQPIDCVKVMMQLKSEQQGVISKNKNQATMYKTFKMVYQSKGIKGLYAGLDSAIMRTIIYTSIRIGIFYQLNDKIKKETGKAPTLFQNSIISVLAGGIGAFFANPSDLILIRKQNDLVIEDISKRRNYKGYFGTLNRIIKEEGFFTLWRGSMPTIIRASTINFSILVPFEYMKKLINLVYDNKLNPKYVSLFGSFFAGMCASILTLPIDNVKTKLQKMKTPNELRNENMKSDVISYKGMLDCFKKTIINEGGVFKLWVGFFPFYARVTLFTVVSLPINDFLRSKLT